MLRIPEVENSVNAYNETVKTGGNAHTIKAQTQLMFTTELESRMPLTQFPEN